MRMSHFNSSMHILLISPTRMGLLYGLFRWTFAGENSEKRCTQRDERGTEVYMCFGRKDAASRMTQFMKGPLF